MDLEPTSTIRDILPNSLSTFLFVDALAGDDDLDLVMLMTISVFAPFLPTQPQLGPPAKSHSFVKIPVSAD